MEAAAASPPSRLSIPAFTGVDSTPVWVSAILAKYRPYLLREARKRVPRDLLPDVMQEIALMLAQYAGRFDATQPGAFVYLKHYVQTAAVRVRLARDGYTGRRRTEGRARPAPPEQPVSHTGSSHDATAGLAILGDAGSSAARTTLAPDLRRLRDLVHFLPAPENDVIRKRLLGRTLAQIGADHNVTRECVRIWERQACKRLRTWMDAAG